MKTLTIQASLLIACAIVVVLWAMRFPAASPLIFDMLPPNQKWPAEQVKEWVQSGNIDKGFVAYFYRDPERTVPEGDNMVSPADGPLNEVIIVDGVKHLVIALSFWDVHMVRSPVAGTVVKVEDAGDVRMEREGKDLVFLREKTAPVQKIVHIQSEWGLVKVRLITGLFARRVEVYPEVGDVVEKGERIGFIHLGSTVVMDVPPALDPIVGLRHRLVGGETIIFDKTSLNTEGQ